MSGLRVRLDLPSCEGRVAIQEGWWWEWWHCCPWLDEESISGFVVEERGKIFENKRKGPMKGEHRDV
jgi:hypothetical protein